MTDRLGEKNTLNKKCRAHSAVDILAEGKRQRGTERRQVKGCSGGKGGKQDLKQGFESGCQLLKYLTALGAMESTFPWCHSNNTL